MGFLAGAVLLSLFAGATLFFSVNAVALRTFSLVRLLEAFQVANGEERPDRVERVTADADRLALACAFYRLLFNLGGLLLLVALISRLQERLHAATYVLAFVLALAIFSVFSLAIPDALARHAGERVISRTYPILIAFSFAAAPVVYFLQLYDGFVRRLAGVPPTTPQEQHEERQEEFLEDLVQRRMEGAVDEEEQEMIENVPELRERMATEIMTPRTDLIAVEYEKTPQESVRKIDENTIEVDARTYVDDLNDRYALDLPEDEDYDTVGGFVFSRLGYVPKAGENFDYGSLKFTIASAEPRRVKRVRIQKVVAER